MKRDVRIQNEEYTIAQFFLFHSFLPPFPLTIILFVIRNENTAVIWFDIYYLYTLTANGTLLLKTGKSSDQPVSNNEVLSAVVVYK